MFCNCMTEFKSEVPSQGNFMFLHCSCAILVCLLSFDPAGITSTIAMLFMRHKQLMLPLPVMRSWLSPPGLSLGAPDNVGSNVQFCHSATVGSHSIHVHGSISFHPFAQIIEHCLLHCPHTISLCPFVGWGTGLR